MSLSRVFWLSFGHEHVVGVVLAQVGGDRGLGQQGIGGDGLAGEVAELVEQRDRDPDLVGALVGAVVTGQHGFF